ncbi:tol-pal system protein YbgF [Aurantimonas sp. Leaf443]|uniref:tol-pal system protein YbgF n=1 Tax=Aurantimonas sp. Leaf443 TaxID=1736378 RepID=UPI0006F336B3|nr:tol-pal system protein YbgF [Aurantimonas sp. Leaf443]KQT88149.1 hypothetical protein ASG48_01505 [Aurantimonas sp. Leaf443]
MFHRSLRAAAAGLALAAAMPTIAPAFEMPFGRAAPQAETRREAPVRMAQASDASGRVSQLEEEMRRLNGKVEELSFQLLQAQEQMRKQQEDIEFRFQELEGAKPAAAGQKRTEAAPAATTPPAAARQTASAAPGGDEIGAILGSGLDTGTVGSTPASTPARKPAGDSGTVASVSPEGPGEMYDLAYNYLLAGDYRLAEDSFRQYSQAYPTAKDAPDAKYWLGESLFQQQKYADAAEVFLNAQKTHPESAKAPEMMLKLGMSLAKLDNRETACVTYREVEKRYPSMTANVAKKLKGEEKSANC